jgi:hypothetical protein
MAHASPNKVLQRAKRSGDGETEKQKLWAVSPKGNQREGLTHDRLGINLDD